MLSCCRAPLNCGSSGGHAAAWDVDVRYQGGAKPSLIACRLYGGQPHPARPPQPSRGASGRQAASHRLGQPAPAQAAPPLRPRRRRQRGVARQRRRRLAAQLRPQEQEPAILAYCSQQIAVTARQRSPASYRHAAERCMGACRVQCCICRVAPPSLCVVHSPEPARPTCGCPGAFCLANSPPPPPHALLRLVQAHRHPQAPRLLNPPCGRPASTAPAGPAPTLGPQPCWPRCPAASPHSSGCLARPRSC